MVKILNEFGFNSYDIKKEDFLKLDNVIQLGYPPYRIDLMMLIDGVTFDECYANRIKKEIDEIEIDFIGYDDLIKNKRASGREKDINDINNLK